jgi:two-component sensor histidine kinase
MIRVLWIGLRARDRIFPAGWETGRLNLTLHHQDDHTFALTVSDDGVGLPPDFVTRSMASLGMQLVRVLVR